MKKYIIEIILQEGSRLTRNGDIKDMPLVDAVRGHLTMMDYADAITTAEKDALEFLKSLELNREDHGQ